MVNLEQFPSILVHDERTKIEQAHILSIGIEVLAFLANMNPKKNSWMQDPRYKHEYLDSGQIWVTITGEDESDKLL